MKRNAHILALLTAAFIFPLIFVGAGVTTKDVGMVFPDWPTSDGSLVNPDGWLSHDGKRWEHGHRLIGWTVGMLAIASAVASWPRRGAARALTLVVLGMIIIQGLLGGLRVTEVSRALAMVHGVWGQLCFCVAVAAAYLSWLASRPDTPLHAVRGARFFQSGAVVAVGAVFLQLCFGAWYRHFGSNSALATHLLWALAVFLVLSWLTMWTLEQYSRLQSLAILGKSMAVLIGAQMVLGGLTLLVKVMGGNWPGWIATMVPTAHVAVGALMFACTVLLAVSGFRMLSTAQERDTLPDPSPAVTT